jgi:hypothetical protein
MSLVSFDTLPDDARLWCFGASRTPEAAELQRLLDAMGRFVAEWTAHRQDLQASFSWVHERFLLVAVDESRAGASGCSIDALTSHLRDLGSDLGLDLLDSMPVWFRGADGGIRTVSRPEFTRLGQAGEVSTSTPVFDLTLERLGEVRAGRLETAAGSAWQRTLLSRG